MATQHYGKDYGANAPQNYEQYFVPAIGAPLATELVDRAALRPGERVLDVACGTGIVARLASDKVGSAGKVAGLDVNPGMLAVARSTAPSGRSLEWHEASAEAIPLPDEAFDAVLCQMGLQFMSDRVGALREMRRVLAKDGRIVLSVPGPTTRVFDVLADAMGRHVKPEAAGFVRQVFALHDNAELHGLLEDAGFRDIDVQADLKTLSLPAAQEFLWQYVSSTPLAPVVAQVGDEARMALERDVVPHWKEFEENGALKYRQRVVVANARK